VIELERVSYLYDLGLSSSIQAVVDVSVSVGAETFLGVAGPSGSGKTTLLQLMGGLLAPSSGSFRLDGEPLPASPRRRRRVCLRVGLVFQFPERQLFESTVYDDVAFGPRNLGLDSREVSERVAEAMISVGLDPVAAGPRSPLALSFGEMRRVALAGILALRPAVLLLDEPTAGLDESGRAGLESLLVSLHRRGMGIVAASHDMALLSELVGELIVLDSGRVVAHGPPAEILREPTRIRQVGLDVPFAADLISTLRTRGWPVEVDSFAREDVIEGLVRAARRGP